MYSIINLSLSYVVATPAPASKCPPITLRDDDPTLWGWVGCFGFAALAIGFALFIKLTDYGNTNPASGTVPLYRNSNVMAVVAIGVFITCSVLAMGQGLVSFDLQYTIGDDAPPKYDFKHDFWSAVKVPSTSVFYPLRKG